MQIPDQSEHYARLSSGVVSAKLKGEISRDLRRTFPSKPVFLQEQNLQGLRRVLYAVSNHCPEIGYCQGMNYVAAVMIYHLQEDLAYEGFARLLDAHQLRQMYCHGFPFLHEHLFVFNRFIKLHLPRIHKHFERMDIRVDMYATEW